MHNLKILLADDHPLFRAALRLTLHELAPEAEILEACCFDTLMSAIAIHPDLDLIILDLTMPGTLGFSSLIYLRSERPSVSIAVISASDQARIVQQTQKFGATAFISKSAPLPEMLKTISAVMDGKECFPEVNAERSEADMQSATRMERLTPQQLRVLMCVANGLLNKQIAYELGIAENTVKVHVATILQKLACSSRTQLAVLVKGQENGLHDFNGNHLRGSADQ